MESINRLHRFLIVAIICCFCIATVGTVVGTEEYDIRAENAIETPEQTVIFQGNSVIIDHIGVVDNDGTIAADVTGPSDALSVELRNADKQIVAFVDEFDDETVSFDVKENGLDPGTYMLLLLDENNNPQRAVPVVVSGYDIDATATESTSESELTISATVTPTESNDQPESVEAVVWNENNREPLTLDGSGESYETTTSLSDFDDESYEIYVSAVGDKPLYNDNNEILGISEATIGDSTDSDNDGSSYSGGGGSSTTDDETDDTDETQNESTNGTDDDSSVIQPTDPTDESTNETDDADQSDGQTDDQTPLSPVVAVIALVAVALVAARRGQ
jgi:hypothetical protein